MRKGTGVTESMSFEITDFFTGLIRRITGETGDLKHPQMKKIGVLIIVGLIGVLLLLFSLSPRLGNLSGNQVNHGPVAYDRDPLIPGIGGVDLTGDEARLEHQLAEVLSQIKGAGEVSIKITFEAGRFYDYVENETHEQNTSKELDTQGLTRETTQTRRSGEIVVTQERSTGLTVPVIRSFTEPRVQGALVVADGAGDIQVKSAIIEAVTTLLAIPYHKVVVLPRQR